MNQLEVKLLAFRFALVSSEPVCEEMTSPACLLLERSCDKNVLGDAIFKELVPRLEESTGSETSCIPLRAGAFPVGQ